MSSASPEIVNCPKCNHQQKFAIWKSMNVTLDPELKAKFIDGSLTTFSCEACSENTGVNYGTLYHDMNQAIMINLSYGEPQEDMSEMAGLFKGYRVRIVGSRNELLEKIFIFDAGLDDRMVELFKVFLTVMLSKEGKEVEELLFQGVESEDGQKTIEFVVMTTADHSGQSGFAMPWAKYEAFAAKYAHVLPEASEEAGKWLRVDASYAKALNLQ